jgi:Ni,Fe-hydrogenase III large subunit
VAGIENRAGSTPSPRSGWRRSGVGIVEEWRGTIVHRVELGPDRSLSQVKIVAPRFLNRPARSWYRHTFA